MDDYSLHAVVSNNKAKYHNSNHSTEYTTVHFFENISATLRFVIFEYLASPEPNVFILSLHTDKGLYQLKYDVELYLAHSLVRIGNATLEAPFHFKTVKDTPSRKNPQVLSVELIENRPKGSNNESQCNGRTTVYSMNFVITTDTGDKTIIFENAHEGYYPAIITLTHDDKQIWKTYL